MEFTTLVTVDTNEYAHHMGDREFGTSMLPKLMMAGLVHTAFWDYIQIDSGKTNKQIEELKKQYKLIKVTVNEAE